MGGPCPGAFKRNATRRKRAGVLCVPALLLLFSALFLLLGGDAGQAVLGPDGTYSNAAGNTLEICADAACATHTVTFSPGDTVYLRVTSDTVNNIGSGNARLRNYTNGTEGAAGAWTQTGFSAPYTFTAQVTIPANVSSYIKVVAYLRASNGQRVNTEQCLTIPTINQYMKVYSDAARTDESYTFAPGATMFLTAYGVNATYSSGYTGTRNHFNDLSGTQATAWPAPTVTRNGSNWYDFDLTLPSTGLINGDWYWIRGWLRNTSGGTILRMSRMVQIDGTAPTAALTAPASGSYVRGSVAITGTANDDFSFCNYLLEYGVGAAPSTWTAIGSTSYTPVNAGLLGSWDTTQVADGIYTLRLTVIDRAYNRSQVTVPVNVDNTPPVISGMSASPVHSSTAAINWSTDEPADSEVEYDTNHGPPYSLSAASGTMTTSHSLVLTGLSPGTTYYYRVRSVDRAGNTTYSAENSFTTTNIMVLQPFPTDAKDTSINSGQPTFNYGAAPTLPVGDGSSTGSNRSLLQFDLSGMPTNAQILSSTLSLYQAGQGDTSTPALDLHAVTAAWKDGTGLGSATGDGATWGTRDGASPWDGPGGDFDPTVSATTTAPNSTGAWVNWDVTALTQAWVANPAGNMGALIKRDIENPSGSDVKILDSSDYTADASLRPKLTIEWTGTDTTPPKLGEVWIKNITTTSGLVTWSTNEGANTQVEYGTTTSYGSSTTLDPAMVNQHSATISGLTAGTTYHYRVVSTDAAGNRAVSGDYIFQTAQVLVIQPGPPTDMDTYINSLGPTLNQGASQFMFTGDIGWSGWGTMRSLLRFDLSSIPAGSTINSATLSLYQFWQANTSTPNLEAHYLTTDWQQGTGANSASGDGATWNTSDGVNPWTTAGGDFNAAASATAVAPNSSAAWVNWDLTGLAQGWVNGSIVNHGVLIKRDTESASAWDAKAYFSADYANPSLRPKLVIEYVPSPASITLDIQKTYNRDGSPGNASVSFGNVNPGTDYYVGETVNPPYAVELSVTSNTKWGLKVSTADDLRQANPPRLIDISNLAWKEGSQGVVAYQPMVKSPAETVIDSNMNPTAMTTYWFDYRLSVPPLAGVGGYSTLVGYTAFSS